MGWPWQKPPGGRDRSRPKTVSSFTKTSKHARTITVAHLSATFTNPPNRPGLVFREAIPDCQHEPACSLTSSARLGLLWKAPKGPISSPDPPRGLSTQGLPHGLYCRRNQHRCLIGTSISANHPKLSSVTGLDTGPATEAPLPRHSQLPYRLTVSTQNSTETNNPESCLHTFVLKDQIF